MEGRKERRRKRRRERMRERRKETKYFYYQIDRGRYGPR